MSDDEAAEGTARELMGDWAVRLVPGIRSFLWSYYGISEDSAKRARELIVVGFDRIEAERDGGDYLVGDRFSVADLAAAALAGPLLAPPEFPWRPEGELPPRLVRETAELSEHPGAQWVLRTYANHRLPSPRPAVATPA